MIDEMTNRRGGRSETIKTKEESDVQQRNIETRKLIPPKTKNGRK
jgi:hypothetical protein